MSATPYPKPTSLTTLANYLSQGDVSSPSWGSKIPQGSQGTNPRLNMPPTTVWNGSDTRTDTLAIAAKIQLLAFGDSEILMNEILPYTQLPPGVSGITWTKHTFGPNLAANLPEQGVPHMVKSNRTTGAANLGRGGIGLMIETGLMDTPQGAMIYAESIRSMAAACQDVVGLGIMLEILQCDNRPTSASMNKRYNNWGWTGQTIEQILEARKMSWDAIKRPNGWLSLDSNLTTMTRIFNKQVEQFDTWLVPDEVVNWYTDGTDETTFKETGDRGVTTRLEGPDSVVKLRGANVYRIRTFNPDGTMPRQVLHAPTQIGECHITKFTADKHYTSKCLSLRVFDEKADGFRPISAEELLIGSCRFNPEDGKPLDINGPQVKRHANVSQTSESFALEDFAHVQIPGGGYQPAPYIGHVDLGLEYLNDFAEVTIHKLKKITGIKDLVKRFETGYKAFKNLMNIPFDESAANFIEAFLKANDKFIPTARRIGTEPSVELTELEVDPLVGFKFPNLGGAGWSLAAPPGFASWLGLRSIYFACKSGDDYVRTALGFDPVVFRTLADFYDLMTSLIPIFSEYFQDSPVLNPKYASSWWANGDVGNVLFENLFTPHMHPLFVAKGNNPSNISADFEFSAVEEEALGLYGDIARFILSKAVNYQKWFNLATNKSGNPTAAEILAAFDTLKKASETALAEGDVISKNLRETMDKFKAYLPAIFSTYAKINDSSPEESLENAKSLMEAFRKGLNYDQNSLRAALTTQSRKTEAKISTLVQRFVAAMQKLDEFANKDANNLDPFLNPQGDDETIFKYLRTEAVYDNGKLKFYARSPLVYSIAQIPSFGKLIVDGLKPKFIPSSFTNPDTTLFPDEYVLVKRALVDRDQEAVAALPPSASISASISDSYTDPRSLASVTNVSRVLDSEIHAQAIAQRIESQLRDSPQQSIGSLGFVEAERRRREATTAFDFGRAPTGDILRRMRATGVVGGNNYDFAASPALADYYGYNSSYPDPNPAERTSWSAAGRYQQPTRVSGSRGGNLSSAFVFGEKFAEMDTDLGVWFAIPRFVQQFADAGSQSNSAGLSRILKQLVLTTPFTLKNMDIFLKKDLPLPMKFIVARPHATYVSAVVVKMIRGEQTGMTCLGPTHFMLSDNAQNQTHQGTLTFNYAVAVTEPNNIEVLTSSFILGYIGGLGTKIYLPNSEMTPYDPSASQYGNKTPLDERASVFVFAVPYYEQLPSGAFSITGELVSGSPSIRNFGSLHYSTAPYYNNLWGFSTPSRLDIIDGGRSWLDVMSVPRANTICYAGATQYWDPKTGSYSLYSSSEGHWSDSQTYAGAHAARIGARRFETPSTVSYKSI